MNIVSTPSYYAYDGSVWMVLYANNPVSMCWMWIY